MHYFELLINEDDEPTGSEDQYPIAEPRLSSFAVEFDQLRSKKDEPLFLFWATYERLDVR
jgi:hypothetical protein